jgi:hypothetical protein
LDIAVADATVVADIDRTVRIVRIVRTVRISVADISKTSRRSRCRMTAVPATSRDNPNNQQRQTSLAHHLPGDGASTGSSAGTSIRFSRRAGIAR